MNFCDVEVEREGIIDADEVRRRVGGWTQSLQRLGIARRLQGHDGEVHRYAMRATKSCHAHTLSLTLTERLPPPWEQVA